MKKSAIRNFNAFINLFKKKKEETPAGPASVSKEGKAEKTDLCAISEHESDSESSFSSNSSSGSSSSSSGESSSEESESEADDKNKINDQGEPEIDFVTKKSGVEA